MTGTQPLRTLTVNVKQLIAKDTYLFELIDPSGSDLAPFTAGAHLPLIAPNGATRQYSLCNDPGEINRYQVAVKREEKGRGGSKSLVDEVNVGDVIVAGPPTNLFALDPKAKSFILIAGGIGITPMMAMVRTLAKEGARAFKLYYLTRDPDATAFREAFQCAPFSNSVVIHHDYGDPSRSYDLWKLLEKPVAGTHVYCCGPKGLMDTVRDMTGHWPTSAIHFEVFTPDTKSQVEDKPFEVVLRRSGQRIPVLTKQTILGALRDHGVHVPSSCESGTCGSCIVRVLEGEPDHRDLVLLPDERADHIMVCVSRAKTDTLVLEL